MPRSSARRVRRSRADATGCAAAAVNTISMSLRKPMSCVPCPTLKLIDAGALTAIPAVDLQNQVLDAEAREPRAHRRRGIQRDVGPTLANVHLGKLLRRFRDSHSAPRRDEHASAVRALHGERRGHAGFVDHFDEKQARAALQQVRLAAPCSALTRLSGLMWTVASTWRSSASSIRATRCRRICHGDGVVKRRAVPAGNGCPRYANAVSSRRTCCASGCRRSRSAGSRRHLRILVSRSAADRQALDRRDRARVMRPVAVTRCRPVLDATCSRRCTSTPKAGSRSSRARPAGAGGGGHAPVPREGAQRGRGDGAAASRARTAAASSSRRAAVSAGAAEGADRGRRARTLGRHLALHGRADAAAAVGAGGRVPDSAVYSRDAGQRAAQIAFNVGQGTQDLGFRNDVDILFTARPRIRSASTCVDEHGKPTMASFLIRDDAGPHLSDASKRLAPDFSSSRRSTAPTARRSSCRRARYTLSHARARVPGRRPDASRSPGPDEWLVPARALDRSRRATAGSPAITTSTPPAARTTRTRPKACCPRT